MIKLVGFNISGMPMHNNRQRDRRSEDQNGRVSEVQERLENGKEIEERERPNAVWRGCHRRDE